MPGFLLPRSESIWLWVGKNSIQREERTQNGKEHWNNELGEHIKVHLSQEKRKKKGNALSVYISISLWNNAVWFLGSYHIMAWERTIIPVPTQEPLCCSCGLVNSLLGSPVPISYQFETEKPSALSGVISLEMVAILKSQVLGRRILPNPPFLSLLGKLFSYIEDGIKHQVL